MLIYICALDCEARPLIKTLGLKKINLLNSFQVFSINEIYLIITGTGCLKSAIAVTSLLTKLSLDNQKNSALLINLGTCGSKKFKIGQAVFPHTITRGDSPKKFYQEILIKNKFSEALLLSLDSAGTTETVHNADCFDMEAYGFFQAASTFLKSTQFFSIKIVSDNLDSSYLNKEIVSKLIEEKLPEISEFTNEMLGLISKPSILNSEDLNLLSILSQKLRFTKYQDIELQKAAESYKVRKKSALSMLKTFLSEVPESKMQAKMIYSAIQEKLNA